MESLEKERSWKEEEFDFVLQFLRTILLKRKLHILPLSPHAKLTNTDGASLIYTIPSVASPLQSLIHSSLGIHSLLKRQPLKHNVIDRDKVVVPPNWDSWGKIRVLREGFDVEAVNKGWSVDIEETPEPIPNRHTNGSLEKGTEAVPGGAVVTYEETIRDPSLDALQAATATETSGLKLEVSSLDAQSFLATQLEVLDKIRLEASGMDSSRQAGGRQLPAALDMGEDGQADEREGRVNEHIGPVQFNMGGIQVDADDMLQRLRVCHDIHSPSFS
jgi:dynein light intermediate chain 1